MRLRAAWASLAVSLSFAFFAGTAAAQSAPLPADADVAAQAAIQRCIGRIEDAPVTLSDVEQRCPDLAAALQAAGIGPLILESSRSRFDVASLRQLGYLLHPAQRPGPAVALLGPSLHGLHPPPTVSRSWWVRFLEWLGAHLVPGQNSGNSPWLSALQHLFPNPEWLWSAIIWIAVISVIVLVAVVVVLEVRATGRKSVDDPLASGERVAAGKMASRLALLRQLPPGQRPAQLFALLIGRLVAAGRLPQDRSLTHREVARRARLENPDERQLIDQLARLSERQLYSDGIAAPAGLDELLARGEDLYTAGWGRPVEP
jgi:hypothetical protein